MPEDRVIRIHNAIIVVSRKTCGSPLEILIRGTGAAVREEFSWLATLDSSRTFIREKAAYSGTTGITCLLSTTSRISLLYQGVFVKRIIFRLTLWLFVRFTPL